MIAKLEWTQSNAQQNIRQLQNPTMGVTINNKINKSPPLQFNNNITLHIAKMVSMIRKYHNHKPQTTLGQVYIATEIYLGQGKQQQKWN